MLAVAALFEPIKGRAIATVASLFSHGSRAASAVVVDLYASNAHLRTSAEDRGLMLGHRVRCQRWRSDAMPILWRTIGAHCGLPLRLGSWAMTVAIVSGVAGCAPGIAGLVAGDVLEADGARVIVVRGYGVQLRGAPSDSGLTLGYARRTYIYPNTTPEMPDLGRYRFWVPQPATAPVAWYGQAIGLDVRTAAGNVGITLGFRGTAVFARVPEGQTAYYRLRFLPDDPASTLLRFCRGEDECASFDFTDF
ncbi:MAG TPA: hypothetical protein VED46_08055 [Alphaproteobacteria bacterium]|nr:hypothetical protein [Alphaproteobacteria bacterium]